MGHDNADKRSDTDLSPLHLDGHSYRGFAGFRVLHFFTLCSYRHNLFSLTQNHILDIQIAYIVYTS